MNVDLLFGDIELITKLTHMDYVICIVVMEIIVLVIVAYNYGYNKGHRDCTNIVTKELEDLRKFIRAGKRL